MFVVALVALYKFCIARILFVLAERSSFPGNWLFCFALKSVGQFMWERSGLGGWRGGRRYDPFFAPFSGCAPRPKISRDFGQRSQRSALKSIAVPVQLRAVHGCLYIRMVQRLKLPCKNGTPKRLVD